MGPYIQIANQATPSRFFNFLGILLSEFGGRRCEYPVILGEHDIISH